MVIWAENKIIEEGRKYKTKVEFQRLSPYAYNKARKLGLLANMTWFDSRDPYSSNVYSVYRYIDKDTATVYVGLTVDIGKRHRQHCSSGASPVYRYFNSIGRTVPEPDILCENLLQGQAQFYEDFYRRKYESEGMNVLNKGNTGVGVGSLGTIASGKWTRDKILSEAGKYSSRSEFKRMSSGAFAAAKREGLLDGIEWLVPKRTSWTEEMFYKEASKFSTRSEFKQFAAGAYAAGVRNGWIDNIHFAIGNTRWTKDLVFEESRKYRSRNEFRKSAGSAYNAANRNGWLDEMTWLKRPVSEKLIWTRENVIAESHKYKTRNEFKKKSPTAYSSAARYCLLSSMTWLKPATVRWNDDDVIAESKKYGSRTEFREKSGSAYAYARRHGLLPSMVWLNRK